MLGSINLSEFATNGDFNFKDFTNTVRIAVKGLNKVLDEGLPLHPLKEQRESVRNWRQIGLGIFGLADMLIKLGIKYGSKESVRLCDDIGKVMADTAIATSAELAKTDGTYPCYNQKAIFKSNYFIQNTTEETKEKVRLCGLHNSQLLTTAPTGSTSSMLGVSNGIEPIYANYYTRKTESLHGHDEYYKVYTPIVEKYMRDHNLTDDSELPDYFVTAQTLNFKDRIDMQSTWQKHIDASISSTVNVPNDFTVEQVEELYMYAWEKKLKGVTIYRDGCARSGILTTEKKEEHAETKLERGTVININNDVIGKKRDLTTGCGTLHCLAYFDPISGDLLETYFSKGSTGGCLLFSNGLSRMISLAARGGVDISYIVDQLKSSGTCPSFAVRRATKHDTSRGSSCPVAIGNALMDMYYEVQNEILGDDEIAEKEIVAQKESPQQKPHLQAEVININKPKCPECGGELAFEGGCQQCKDCGWSKCD